MANSTTEPITQVLESDSWDSLEALAAESAELFLRQLWPWVTSAFTQLRRSIKDDDSPGFAISYHLDLRFEDERDGIDLPEKSILGAFRAAVESFTDQDPIGFEKWLSEIEAEDAVPAQRLFAHGLTSMPEHFAKRSLRFFMDNLNRLHLGNSYDLTATATRLVAAVSPYWSDEELEQFEEAVLDYKPIPRAGLDAKSRQYFDQLIRKLKLRVLSALPEDRTSKAVKNRIAEERRRFPDAAANAWADTDARSASSSSKLLQQLIPVATPRMWHAILDLFRLVDEIEPDDNWIPLLSILADNLKAAHSRESTFIVDRLQTLLPHQAILVGKIAMALVESWRNDLGDIQTGTAAVAPDFVDIAVTLHRLGPETRDLGTSLFEELLEVNAYSARATLDQIDNRFRSPGQAQPRRLARRRRKQRRTKGAA